MSRYETPWILRARRLQLAWQGDVPACGYATFDLPDRGGGARSTDAPDDEVAADQGVPDSEITTRRPLGRRTRSCGSRSMTMGPWTCWIDERARSMRSAASSRMSATSVTNTPIRPRRSIPDSVRTMLQTVRVTRVCDWPAARGVSHRLRVALGRVGVRRSEFARPARPWITRQHAGRHRCRLRRVSLARIDRQPLEGSSAADCCFRSAPSRSPRFGRRRRLAWPSGRPGERCQQRIRARCQ